MQSRASCFLFVSAFCGFFSTQPALAGEHGRNAVAMVTEYRQKTVGWTNQIRIEKLRAILAEAERGVAQEDTLAMALLGVTLQTDTKAGSHIVIPMNRQRAYDLLSRSYARGDIEAAHGLILAYANGWGVAKDSGYALTLANEAIGRGCKDCSKLQSELQNIASKGQFSSKIYDGGPIAGRVANFDILGVKVNMPYSQAVQIIRNNGYTCTSTTNYPTFWGQVQQQVNRRFPTRSQPVQSILANHRCKKIEAATIQLTFIGTARGALLSDIEMDFDGATTDKNAIQQRILTKYGKPNSNNGFNFSWCDEYGINTCYSPYMSYKYNPGMTLKISLPASMRKNIYDQLEAEIAKAAPKSSGTNF